MSATTLERLGLRGEIGLALGSGAARGWAHVGALRALVELGVRPRVVCGASIGAVVGAVFAAGALDEFERWGRSLTRSDLVSYVDLSFRGGMMRGRKLFEVLAKMLGERAIESLPVRYGAVATDLATGQEVWLRSGSIVEALRATTALPGMITPHRRGERWLVDGGLVNPVPASLCRAMGADSVIAVDLNTGLVGRRFQNSKAHPAPAEPVPPPAISTPAATPASLNARSAWQDWLADLRSRFGPDESESESAPPSLYEVVANSINIMQARITRSRAAGDPPDLLVAPRLDDFGLLDFDRAADGIEAGRRAVARALASLDGDASSISSD